MTNPTSTTAAAGPSKTTSAATAPSTAPKKRSHHAPPFSTSQRPKKAPRRRRRPLSPNSRYARTAPPVTTSNWAPAGQVEREVDEATRQYWEVQANGHIGAFFLPPYDGTVPSSVAPSEGSRAPPVAPTFRPLTPPPHFAPLPPLERLVLVQGQGREREEMRRRQVDERRRVLDEHERVLRERDRVLVEHNRRLEEQARQLEQLIQEQDRRRRQREVEKRQQTDVQVQQQSLADQPDNGHEQGQPDQPVQQQGQQAAGGTQAEAEEGDGAGKREDEDQDDIEYLTDIVTGEINPTGFFHGTAGVTPYEYWLLPYQQDRPRR
ncbi:hypothetical protein SLS58_006397 [Diplodia intermedia]|uniref:Uncharacterized protein n=1 Tax=Diplodia intermedia TaxID=856260 RepID=A0ABR3TNC2_9PEZI